MLIGMGISVHYPLSMWTPEWDLNALLPLFNQRMDLRIFPNPHRIMTPMYSPLSLTKFLNYQEKSYQSTLPTDGKPANEQEEIDVAFRVIGDHLRALCFSIADGILPGNGDRNYVLRRILRRGIRYGRNLGFEKPFFHLLAPTLIEQMGTFFPELKKREELIIKTLLSEEESFNKTLDRGIELCIAVK